MPSKKPHPLQVFNENPEFESLVRGMSGVHRHDRAAHGALADWFEEQGHPVIASLARRHPVWAERQDEGMDHGRPYFRGMGEEEPISRAADRGRGLTTELSYGRMFPTNDFTPLIHTVNLSHWGWWGDKQGHALHLTAPVTKAELRQLLKQYGRRDRASLGAHELIRHRSNVPGAIDYPDMGGLQLAREPMPALPTRESVGQLRQKQVPENQTSFGFHRGVPYHYENGTRFNHDPQKNPEAFNGHMERLGSPLARHMQAAAGSGHAWEVHPSDFAEFAKYDPTHLAHMAGGQAGDSVHFEVDHACHHTLSTSGRGENSGVNVGSHIDPKNGTLTLHHVYGPEGVRGTGWGLDYFLRAVTGARRSGVKSVVVPAAAGHPGSGYNGYYTWPRFGFNGPITPGHALPPKYQRAKTLHQLFDMEGGPEAWKKYGSDQFNLSFDTAPGSPHTQRLLNYLREVQARKAGK